MKINRDFVVIDLQYIIILFGVFMFFVATIIPVLRYRRKIMAATRKQEEEEEEKKTKTITSYRDLYEYVSNFTLTDDQYNELIDVLKKRQISVSSISSSSSSGDNDQGWLYAYQMTWINVEVTNDRGQCETDWVLVKVGRSDPEKIQKRLQGELSLLVGNNQKLPVKFAPTLPVLSPTTSRKYYDEAQKNWCRYDDLLFLFNCDTSKEAKYRHYPTGLGVEVGTGRFAVQPPTMNLEWCTTKTLKIKAKALRAWILGLSMNPSTNCEPKGVAYADVTAHSLGESEWVIVPKNIVNYVKLAQLTSEDEYIELMQRVYQDLSLRNVQSVTLTLVDRPDHN